MLTEIKKHLIMGDAILQGKYEIAIVLFYECMEVESPKRRQATVDIAINSLTIPQEPTYNWNTEVLPLLNENGYTEEYITKALEDISIQNIDTALQELLDIDNFEYYDFSDL